MTISYRAKTAMADMLANYDYRIPSIFTVIAE